MKANSIYDMSVLYGFIIAAVVLVLAVCSAICGDLTTYRFVAPGLGGMVSNYDAEMLQATDAFYLFNGYVTEKLGVIERRTAISDYGVNVTSLYGAYGYYNPLTGDKLVLGVTAHADYGLGQLVVSDTFGTEVGYDTLPGTIFPYADVYHDWTPYEDMLIHADGKSIPVIFTTTQEFKYGDSTPDTAGYQAHVISMGLEAPGQLRVQTIDTSGAGELNGRYQYALAFMKPYDSTPTGSECYWRWRDTSGAIGLPSAIVVASNQNVLVTLFESYPNIEIMDSAKTPGCLDLDSTKSILLRRRMDAQQIWYTVDTLFYTPDRELIYIDSIGDTISTSFSDTLVDTSTAVPGRFWKDDVDYANLYRIAYSYYDPITGIESPLGPSIPFDTGATDERIAVDSLRKGWTKITERPKWIRLYQTINKITLPGGGDTTVWYGLFELRVNSLSGSANDSLGFGIESWWDSTVVGGLDSSDISTDTIYKYQILRNDLGDGSYSVKVLPPYNFDCQIPFSDIEYFYGQFWGIGDPDYPSRIYWSQFDWPTMNIFSWPPLWFTQIRELGNDALIAIELAEGYGYDAIYLLAHNSIWLMDEEGSYQAISTRLGAASRETVVKHGDSVYFLSPNLRIYVLAGTQVTEISQGIDNFVESVFVDWQEWYGYQGFYASGHTLGDYVRWFNDTTGMGLSFNTRSHVWTLERYGSGAYVPRGSFAYDTMHSSGVSIVMTSDVELLYTDSTVSLRKADPTAYYDVAGSGATNFLERAIQFAYWTPQLGDENSYHQIQEFDLTLDIVSPGAFHYTIYNKDNDSLCGDSVSLLYNDTTVYLRIHPPYNNCLRPSLKIYTNDTDTLTTGGAEPQWVQYYHNFNVKDMTVKVRDMGVGNVQ